MTGSIENICYEYSEDVLFSQDISFDGSPVLIILEVELRYAKELSYFLKNYGYKIVDRKNIDNKYSLLRFELINLSKYDKFFKKNDKNIGGQ
jgi:hypothetical protein